MEGQDIGFEQVRWRFANAEYNERSHELTVANVPVALEPKPLEVLISLLRAEGELVTKQELFDTVWAGRVVTDGVLSQAIRRIREVLGDADRTMVRTVHGYGFRLDVPIEIEGRDDPGTRLQLEVGQCLPNLPQWVLEERLQTRPANELWRIRHANNRQCRVVKLALDDRAQRALKREVTLNRVLRAELGDDAPLVPVLGWQFESSPAWILMPWYPHGSLVDWLKAQGGPEEIALKRRLRIVVEAAEALSKAHALGVMHKDIKPGNLLVERGDGDLRLLLCDFGSGTVKSRDRLAKAGVTVMGFTKTVHDGASTSGTPAYMAPEVLKGGVFSEQSDVYALGVLLYQLVIGDLHEPLAPGWEEDVADVGLRGIIADACAGKPGRRIPSMDVLADRLRTWMSSPAVDSESAAAPARSVRARLLLAGAVAVALAVAVGFWPWHRSSPQADRPNPDPAGAAAPVAQGQRLAILAFELLGLDEQTETVMGGLQDALMADLANLADVRLVHGHKLDALGLGNAPAEKIGEILNVDQLIRGSVQQFGEQLRVNLQIVDAKRGEAVWGRSLQGTRANLFKMQAMIAQTLADALGTSLVADTKQPIGNEAYEAYLAALSMWKQGLGDDEKLDAAIGRALELAPHYIEVNLLAVLKAARDYWFSNATREESEARIAEHLAELERQNTPPVKLATARAVRRYYLENDPRGGVDILAPFERHLIRSTESAMFYAYMLRRIGRVDEAFEILEQIADRDPSAMVPVETKAELLAFLGRGGEALAVLRQVWERFGNDGHIAAKIASFAYDLTGSLDVLKWERAALQGNAKLQEMEPYIDREIARRQGRTEAVLALARELEGKDKIGSGHGRIPAELERAFALRAGQAPADEVRAMAGIALEKLERWRAESDSDARRSTMAMALALLDRADEAVELSAQVEQAYPLERDQLEAADRLLEAAVVHAVIGNEQGALTRLQKLSGSKFVNMSLCLIPFGMEHEPIWQLPKARQLIEDECSTSWSRNRDEILPMLGQWRVD